MKKAGLLPLLCMLTALGFPQAGNAQQDLLGRVTIEQLIDLEGWFGSDYLAYTPERQYMDGLGHYLDEVDIVCFFGSWCDDAKREVPRFLKLMQILNIDPSHLTLIGVDRNHRSPGGDEQTFSVEKIPTFIFRKNGKELGRIVETPLASMEKDIRGFFVVQPPPPPPMPQGPPPDGKANASPATIQPVDPSMAKPEPTPTQPPK